MVGSTLWSDEVELFMEHPVAVAGRPIEILIHLTRLDEFRPLDDAALTLEFEGPAKLSAHSPQSLRPGVFFMQMVAQKPGLYSGRLRVEGEQSSVVENLELEVFAPGQSPPHEHHDEHEGIEFLKEQQWGVPFGTAFVGEAKVVASVVVSGRVDTPPGGNAVVGAPVTGRLVAPVDGLPRPGQVIQKGQVLAFLSPAPTSPEAASRATLAVTEAEARLSSARRALERAERLIRDEAISVRELEDAKRERQVAQEALNAANRGAALYSGARGSVGKGSWRLTAPIDGTLVSVLATPGATVSPGETLFRLVDTSELWIVARVPEQDAARLRDDRDASFKVAGLETWMPITLSGQGKNASIVTFGRTVDPVTRTVDAIYALQDPDLKLRVGGLVQVSLPAGEDFTGLAIPRTALIDQNGRSVVYVQKDGEHFVERAIRLGPRAGNWIGVVDGLLPGERIVTKGAHLVRLAEQAGNAIGHGHIH